MERTYYVYWMIDDSQVRTFCADIYPGQGIRTAAQARALFRAMYPDDKIIGIKEKHGNGRWLA